MTRAEKLCRYLGITPESHPWLFISMHYECLCCGKYLGLCASFDYDEPCCRECDQAGVVCVDPQPVCIAPDPDVDDPATDVYIGPLLRLISKRTKYGNEAVVKTFGEMYSALVIPDYTQIISDNPGHALYRALLEAAPDFRKAQEEEA